MSNLVKINDFEGPLDLLLHLIKENKMDIFDIEITVIIAQYLAYLDEAKTVNLEITSDFLVMASSLLEIKSKLLLPKPELEEDDDYEQSAQDELVRRLIEYKRYKEVSGMLKEYNDERNMFYTKPLEDLTQFKSDDNTLEIPDSLELYDLIRSMDKIQQRLKFRQPMSSVFENSEISVEDRCTTLMEQLTNMNGSVLLDDLIDIPTKSYLIVTFLALLDLAKRNMITIMQSDGFARIYIDEVI